MKTEIYLPRIAYTEKSTTGLLVVDGVFWNAHTLEDRARIPGVKVPGETAISSGRYKLSHRFSPKFKRQMLWVTNVPGFEFIYFHSGNKSEDTLGCILVARNRPSFDMIFGESLAIERSLYTYVEKRGFDEAYLTITDGPGYNEALCIH